MCNRSHEASLPGLREKLFSRDSTMSHKLRQGDARLVSFLELTDLSVYTYLTWYVKIFCNKAVAKRFKVFNFLNSVLNLQEVTMKNKITCNNLQ